MGVQADGGSPQGCRPRSTFAIVRRLRCSRPAVRSVGAGATSESARLAAVVDGFDVRAGGAVVEGWSSRRLPFEPKGWLLDYRTALRRAIGALDHPCPELYCAYTSVGAGRCDVENVLLYNLGASAFAGLEVTEVVVERLFHRPEPPHHLTFSPDHHHLYRCGPSATSPGWPSIATWPPTTVAPPFRIERIWSALRTSTVPMVVTDPATAHLSLRLDLEHPSTARPPAILSAMKVLIDGAIASLHVHDGSRLDDVAGRLAARLGRTAPGVAEELMDPAHAVLGKRRLLWPLGNFVQWNPADDGIVWLRVKVHSGDAWRISGDLKAIDPSKDNRHPYLI